MNTNESPVFNNQNQENAKEQLASLSVNFINLSEKINNSFNNFQTENSDDGNHEAHVIEFRSNLETMKDFCNKVEEYLATLQHRIIDPNDPL